MKLKKSFIYFRFIYRKLLKFFCDSSIKINNLNILRILKSYKILFNNISIN